ncbi:MAG: Gfo/Idh/MocA family oxidoreductase [Caulobacteraceae bacterium]
MTWRIGLLGASRIAPTAVIAPMRADGRFAITAVAARDPTRARAFADEYGIEVVAEDYAALIARDDIDLIYNALPPAGHARWTIAALEAGKHVLCEKPFARDAGEARAMVEAAARARRVLLEAFHYRFHAVMRRAEALVRQGALGTLRRGAAEFHAPIPRTAAELRWRADQGGGALMDLGCYPLHALRTLVGAEPVIDHAHGMFVSGVDEAMSAEIHFAGGIEATIDCSMTPPAPSAWLWLEGDRGRLEIINFLAPQLGCRFTLAVDGKTAVQSADGPSTYVAQLHHLHDVLQGDTAAMTGGNDAIANMSAIDGIYAAARREP